MFKKEDQRYDLISYINEDENLTLKEVLLDKFIIRVDPTYFYTIKLEYGSESSISLQLSPTEKVEKVVGIKDFRFAKLTDFSCYRFGGHTAMSLEEMYGKEGTTSGVYYQSYSMSKSEYDTQISNIESIGFKKINEIRDNGMMVNITLSFSFFI